MAEGIILLGPEGVGQPRRAELISARFCLGLRTQPALPSTAASPIIDEYLADLARSVNEARAVTGPSPTRAVY